MGLIEKIFGFFFRKKNKNPSQDLKKEEISIYESSDKSAEEIEEVYSIWDYLQFVENSQAYHIKTVIGFDEWVTMEEIRRRIKELYGIDYKNEKSLYSYIKTLTDTGLLDSLSAGGKRKWRKKGLLIKIKRLAEKKKIETETTN